MISRKACGDLGEAQAAAYLQQQGYQIIMRNFRTKIGEIDIIVSKNNCLYFVEVKKQRFGNFGKAIEQITYTKKQRIIGTAEIYLAENAWQGDCSFLVIAIDGDNLEMIEDTLY